ncbi:MAG: CpsB/CapC family capsule biosynthesis tyrosine phosphatase [Phycisphaerales bacterium]
MIAPGHSSLDLERRIAAAISFVRKQGRFVDVHCHCLPALDDGPGSLEESLELCRALVEDNVGLVVATPHQLGRYETRTDGKRISDGVRCINRELSARGLDLVVLPGAEVRLDERICTLLAGGEILTLADRRRHILLELPSDVFIDVEPLLCAMAARNVTAVLAHPERNLPLLRHLDVVSQWRACGLRLQVTAASIVGGFGGQAEAAAWELLARGWVDVVASDAHDVDMGRPRMRDACARMADELDHRTACRLCIANPLRVVSGQELVPVRFRMSQEAR